MVRKLLTLLILSIATAASAQFSTTVSSSGVTDLGGTSWVGGKYQISFVPDPKIPVPNYTWSGGNLQNNLVFQGNLSGPSATFSVSIPSNSSILPVGSQWLVKVCPNAASSCYGVTYTVQGATMDLTATLNAALPNPQIVSQGMPWAYKDLELITPPSPGAMYYNVTDNFYHCWTGSAWTVTCTSGGGGGGGGTILGSTTASQGVATTTSPNTLGPLPEVNYTTVSGNLAFACEEDQNRGDYDPRCIRSGVSWVSNARQALINTIQVGVCNHYTLGYSWPTIHIPGGPASLGGNISLPPNVDIEGPYGSQYGDKAQLTTSDSTQTMFTHVSSQTFNCGGMNYTDNAGTGTMGYVTLIGGGSAHATDVGVTNNMGGSTLEYLHNMTFLNFGGPARTLFAGNNGQGSRGEYLNVISPLQWYMFSGAYNTSGFTDTGAHCGLELYDLDSRWFHLEETGYNQDTGFYNRYNLIGACMGGGGQNSWIKDSYIQLFPRGIYVANINNGGQLIQTNRIDGSWWEALSIGAGTIMSDNLIQGYATSPTLNPANFGTNPGGVTTDANAAAIKLYAPFGLGSVINPNSIGIGIWPQWPVCGVWASINTLNSATSTIDLPGAKPGDICGQIGGDSGAGNFGADVFRSVHQTSSGNYANTGGTIHFKGYAHTYLNDTTTANYTTVDGIWPDFYVTVEFRGTHSTITAGSGITLCPGVTAINSGIHWFYTYDGTVLKEVCPSSSGSGGGGNITGSGTANTYTLWTGLTAIGNGHLTESGGNVISSLPLQVNDSSGVGGGAALFEGTAPTAVATTDTFYADNVKHWMLFNPNATSWYAFLGTASSTPFTAGDCLQAGTHSFDIVDSGTTNCGGTTGYFSATAAGVAAASTMQMSLVSGVGRLQAYSSGNVTAANLTLAGSTADGTTAVSFYLQCVGGTSCTENLPAIFTAQIRPGSTITTVNCSTSGTVNFAQPIGGASMKKVHIQEVSCVGTASYTYPTGFTVAPFALGPKSADATSITTSAVTITGSGSGQLTLESLN